MNLTRLRQFCDLAPAGTMIPVESLRGMLEEAEQGGEAAAPSVTGGDLTIEEVATRMHRHANTVRDWCRAGTLRSYKLNGRDYRITEAALREYIEAQQNSTPQPRATKTRPNLGRWRSTRKAG